MENKPWYQKAHRWCQCNLTEIDARDCDIQFWRDYWRKNGIQGTIVNAGGTVAYFPSENPYQYRAKFLGERDLTKEFIDAAHEEGLAVMARMDINQATRELYEAKPDWFARKADGTPHMMGTRYITCINGGYYTEQIPRVMSEIIERYHPEGLGDNSWTGARSIICYCENCRRMFREYCGMELPRKEDMNDRAYRLWLQWSIHRRTEIFKYFNEITQKIGGEDCLWMGMVHSDFYPNASSRRLYDYAEFSEFSKAQMVDSQARDGESGFEQNGVNGMAMHEVFGDDALIIESMAQYYFCGHNYFMRRAAHAPEEVRTWMRSGISAGIAPSPHYIGSKQDDNRMFDACTPVMHWQRANEEYLFNRQNAARVGLCWSTKNLFFYSKGDTMDAVKLPFSGMVYALRRGRIGYFPVNASHVGRKQSRMDLLVLPDVAVMTDGELRQAEDFVKQGGSVVMTGGTGMLDELGYPRSEFPLDRLFGITRKEKDILDLNMGSGVSYGSLDKISLHNYMRLNQPPHPIVQGFEGADILSVHGQFYSVRSSRLESVAQMVPPFPTYPPEFSYMDDDKRTSEDPAILAGETGYGGRFVYFAADLDRRYGETRFPDTGDVLVNAIRWALDGGEPFTVAGPGLLDCKLYRQPGRFILHILNHTGLPEFPYCTEEYCPVGPQEVSVKVGDLKVRSVSLKVSGGEVPFRQEGGAVRFTLDSIVEHELAVIE